MATLATTPIELYLHTSYEPDAEFVDGEVEERPTGEYDHATWQQALQLWFHQHAKADPFALLRDDNSRSSHS